jgi:hypothetical protein
MGRRRYDRSASASTRQPARSTSLDTAIRPHKKWRNVLRDGRVSLVVDDVLPPWRPRAIEVRGRAEALPDQAGDGIVPGAPPGVIRIHPIRILAFGIEEGGPGTRTVEREPTQPGLADTALCPGVCPAHCSAH